MVSRVQRMRSGRSAARVIRTVANVQLFAATATMPIYDRFFISEAEWVGSYATAATTVEAASISKTRGYSPSLAHPPTTANRRQLSVRCWQGQAALCETGWMGTGSSVLAIHSRNSPGRGVM
jgi:hypothetical protein